MPSTTPPPKPISIEMLFENSLSNQLEEYNLNMCSNYNTHLFSLDESPSSHRLKQYLNKLSKIEANWDGYGGLPVSKKVIKITSNLFEKLPNILVSELEEDDISPNSNGTISIEWIKDNQNKLFLEIGETAASYFVKRIGVATKFVNELPLLETQIPSELINDLKQLIL